MCSKALLPGVKIGLHGCQKHCRVVSDHFRHRYSTASVPTISIVLLGSRASYPGCGCVCVSEMDLDLGFGGEKLFCGCAIASNTHRFFWQKFLIFRSFTKRLLTKDLYTKMLDPGFSVCPWRFIEGKCARLAI